MNGQANSIEYQCYLVTKGTRRFGPLILIDTDLVRFPWEKARLTLHESKVLFIYTVCVLEQNLVLPNLKLHLEYFGSICPKSAGQVLCSCHKMTYFSEKDSGSECLGLSSQNVRQFLSPCPFAVWLGIRAW